jgi:hypothetical protein
MSWVIYVFIFIPATFSTFHIPEICQIDAQNLHIAAICVTVDLLVIVFTQCVSICMICRHTEFILPVSSGLLAVAIILKPKQGLHMDTVLFYILDKHYINEVLYLLEIY